MECSSLVLYQLPILFKVSNKNIRVIVTYNKGIWSPHLIRSLEVSIPYLWTWPSSIIKDPVLFIISSPILRMLSLSLSSLGGTMYASVPIIIESWGGRIGVWRIFLSCLSVFTGIEEDVFWNSPSSSSFHLRHIGQNWVIVAIGICKTAWRCKSSVFLDLGTWHREGYWERLMERQPVAFVWILTERATAI